MRRRPAVDETDEESERARLKVLIALRKIVPKLLFWQQPGTTKHTEIEELVVDFRVAGDEAGE
jgi:hypothetical protein